MTTMTKLAKRVGDFKHLKPGTRVQFMNEGIYEVEAVEEDVLYLIDEDGSSFTATEREIFKECRTMKTKTKLAKRVGDFKYSSGCLSAEELRKAYLEQWNTFGEKGFREMYEDFASFTCDNKGIILSFYDFGDGGYGSCFIELVPYVDEYKDGKLELFYDLYVEEDGHLEEIGSFLANGSEEQVVLEFEKAMLEATEEIAENWKFYKGDLCESKEYGVTTFVRYESCGDECVIRLAKSGSTKKDSEEVCVPRDSIRPYFA